MSRSQAITTAFLGTFVLALAMLAVAALVPSSAANEPLYRLDARYHNLPPKLVADLLAHPPERAPTMAPTRCASVEEGGEQTGYCVCFGAEACATAPNFHSGAQGRENWTCVGPLGAVDDKGTAVCRADLRSITVTAG